MSFVFEFEHAFTVIGEFSFTNIYLPQKYIIPYNDIGSLKLPCDTTGRNANQ